VLERMWLAAPGLAPERLASVAEICETEHSARADSAAAWARRAADLMRLPSISDAVT
jgi:hypothetical protein